MNGEFVTHETVVKGDGKYLSIAAASVIAKVTRDRHMKELAKDPKYSMYNWEKNKSYCTPDHIRAIIEHGKSDRHRMTFKVPGYDK
jgi:ribonuclease HII